MSSEKETCFAGQSETDSESVRDEFLPFLESYEETLRRGEACSPEQWLLGQAPVPHELRDRLAELHWLHCAPLDGAPSAESHAAIPGYEILELLSHGRMGCVYKARQVKPERIVAVKTLDRGAYVGPDELGRFRKEPEAVARLQHPNIVQIYEMGEHEGRPFFSMEFIDGESLAKALAGKPLLPNRSAKLVETVARAVHYAHQRGVVHRDLKPANILMQQVISRHHSTAGHQYFDNSHTDQCLLADECCLKITDFGLAKRLDAEIDQTATGAVVGTPSYMSPEQATGQSKDVGPLTDVYALGVLLYELLTGQIPFKGPSVLETLEMIRSQDPVPPGRLQPKLPRDLETICLKCLEKEPAKRYESAQAVADDLERFLQGKPVRARPMGTSSRAWRWCKRNKGSAAAILFGVFFFLALGGGGFLLERNVAADASMKAAVAKEHEAAAVREAAGASEREQIRRREGLMQRLQRIRTTGNRSGWSTKAWKLAAEMAEIRIDHDLTSQAAAVLSGLDASLVKSFAHPSTAVAWDAGGKRLLLGGSGEPGEHSEPARVWDRLTDITRTSRQSGVSKVAFGPDGAPLELLARDKWTLLLWDIANKKPLSEISVLDRGKPAAAMPFGLRAYQLSADGTLVAASTDLADGTASVRIWAGSSGKLLREYGSTLGVDALAFSSDKTLLVAGNESGEASTWSLADGKQLISLRESRMDVQSLSFSPDSKIVNAGKKESNLTGHLAVGHRGGTITIWNLETRSPTTHCYGSPHEVLALAFSPDGVILASGGRCSAKLWNSRTGRLLLDLDPGSTNAAGLNGYNYVAGIAFSPDGKELAVASPAAFGNPGRADVWGLQFGRGIQTLSGLTGQIARIGFSANGRLLAAVSHNWQAAIWDTDTGQLRRLLDTPKGLLADNLAMAFSPDAKQFAFSTYSGAKLWEVDSGKEIGNWDLPAGLQDLIGYHPSGKLLLFRVEPLNEEAHSSRATDSVNPPPGCRVRDLLGPNPTKPLYELKEFNHHVYSARAPADVCYFVVEGIGGTPEAPRRMIRGLDGVSGKMIVEFPSELTVPNGGIYIDSTGQFLNLDLKEEPKGVVHRIQLAMPSGKVLRPVANHDQKAWEPKARYWIDSNRGDPNAFVLIRAEDGRKLVTLAIDSLGTTADVRLDPSEHRVAWGTPDGTVFLCDMAEIQKRLNSIGLGW
jgi:serine/threonine protein kinase/WD40 repeat protein